MGIPTTVGVYVLLAHVQEYSQDLGVTSYYYLRPLKHCQSRALAGSHPHAPVWGVVVEYIDRARGPTLDFFTQTLPVTLSTTAKLTPLKHFTIRNENRSKQSGPHTPRPTASSGYGS